MATNKRITELTELSEADLADDDVLAIVDVSAQETFKVRKSTLASALSGVSSVAATSPIVRDQATGTVTLSLATVPIASGGTGATSAAAARTALGVAADPLTTRGDVIRRGASATERLALGSSGQVLQSNGADVVYGTVPVASIAGTLPLANGGTAATSASAALASLGAAARGSNSDITALTGLSTDLSVAQGGTGSSTASGARTNLGLGTSATLNVGTSASQIVQLNGSAELPAVSAVNLTNLPASSDLSGDLRNIALGSAADRITLLNGIVDPLTDETDVNTSSSTNETFTSTSGGFYTGKAQAEVSYSGSANIGDMTFGGGLATAFDDNINQGMTACARSNTGVNLATAFVGKDWGSGNTKTITGVKVYGSSDQGYIDGTGSTVTIDVLGSNTTPSNSGDGTVLATVVTAMTDISSVNLQEKLTGFTETAFRFVWVRLSPNPNCTMAFAEIEFFETNALNMELISTPFTATSAPTTSVLGFQTVENDATTINTDLKGFVSRDGGSNFTEMTLALKSTLGQTGTKYYECAETTLTSTSGSSMVYKITTHNAKDIQIHGVALSWS
tara:strand:- start:514 stop:2211 length:1698 start_codon:yes stop_codon:yes gene_type:complete